jgi:hypothetical protein
VLLLEVKVEVLAVDDDASPPPPDEPILALKFAFAEENHPLVLFDRVFVLLEFGGGAVVVIFQKVKIPRS